MILPIKFKADWELIRKRKQDLINKNNERENATRINHDWTVGKKVLKLRADRAKMDPKREGPFTITRCHTNGTVTIVDEEGINEERLNIRQIIPFKE